MVEWHLPPDYIMSHWTEELLALMIDKLVQRKQKENGIISKPVPNEQFFKQAGIKVVKRGN